MVLVPPPVFVLVRLGEGGEAAAATFVADIVVVFVEEVDEEEPMLEVPVDTAVGFSVP